MSIKEEEADYSSSDKTTAWLADQMVRSEFFHEKLHQWGLIETAKKIDQVKGEKYEWDLQFLEISGKAWKRIIHRGIKPVTVFAHPQILTEITGSLGYYRMLSMVSQKSMSNVGLSIQSYEREIPIELDLAEILAKRLNKIISFLIESDEELDARELDIWRGIAVAAQAQGSWGSSKRKRVEQVK